MLIGGLDRVGRGGPQGWTFSECDPQALNAPPIVGRFTKQSTKNGRQELHNNDSSWEQKKVQCSERKRYRNYERSYSKLTSLKV